MQKTFTDQLGYQITFNYPPKRIISLVPSQTELLFDLGLDDEMIGITKFCIHPKQKCATKTKIGGTKHLNIDLIKSLQPDLIIGNKEENTKEDIAILKQHFAVWLSDVNTLEEAETTIAEIGELVDRQPEASYLNHLISAGFRDLQVLAVEKAINKKVAYMIWNNPCMFAGKKTFINDVLAKIGLTNVVETERYPNLELEDLKKLQPDFILLSSEPFPFNETHVKTFEEALPNVKIMLINGEMCSWYGSRLVKAVQYFFELQNNFIENE